MSNQINRLRNSIRALVKSVIAEEKKKKVRKEITVTGNVAGYQTPRAFAKDGKHDKAYVKKMADLTGYQSLQENRLQQLRKETERTPKQKIGQGIRELRTQIQEIEKFVEWYGKIKAENDLSGDQFWERTKKHIGKMNERLKSLREKITQLRK